MLQKIVAKVLVALAVVVGASWASTANAQYAVIAFSQSTGEYGYAWNHWNYSDAARVALSRCNAKDAEVVAWVENGFAALAIGDNDSTYGTGWEWGDGATNIDAINTAKENCRSYGKRVKTIVVVHSHYFNPQVIK